MNYLIHTGRIFFAIALTGLGVTHFVFGDFTTGRAPGWPDLLPGGKVWAYLAGAFFMAAGLVVLSGKKARVPVFFAGVLIFIWAFLRHLPVIAADSFLSPAWTEAGKALTLFSGAWVIAAVLPKVANSRSPFFSGFINLQDEFILTGRTCLGIFLLITGIQHFMFTEFVASLIPEWFPGDALFWTHFGGVALIAGGTGLFIPKTAQWAAFLSGTMVFCWFLIIHIPRTFASVSDGFAVFEALAVSGIAFVIAGFLGGQKEKQ